jgi:heme O synthase-like polyprenyltransferase
VQIQCLILFVRQLPHFFAIAWLYRDDYASGGFSDRRNLRN